MFSFSFFHSSLISQLQKLQSLIAAKVPRAVTARSTQTSTCLMVRFLACIIVYLHTVGSCIKLEVKRESYKELVCPFTSWQPLGILKLWSAGARSETVKSSETAWSFKTGYFIILGA